MFAEPVSSLSYNYRALGLMASIHHHQLKLLFGEHAMNANTYEQWK